MRILSDDDVLPLTCTRSGTCCHGKDIRVTPWELALLARERGMSAQEFRRRHTVAGGTQLACTGPPGWRGLPACSQYDPARGCTAHAARPLACRLYPLGRARNGATTTIFHEGERFPCLDGCPEVSALPKLRVSDYLSAQDCARFAVARDLYTDIAQDVAEGAFVIAFDSGLHASSVDWLGSWRAAVAGGPEAWVSALTPEWHDRVTAPTVTAHLDVGEPWVVAHAALIQEAAQDEFASLRDFTALSRASATMFASALCLLHGVGGDATDVGQRWITQAQQRH